MMINNIEALLLVGTGVNPELEMFDTRISSTQKKAAEIILWMLKENVSIVISNSEFVGFSKPLAIPAVLDDDLKFQLGYLIGSLKKKVDNLVTIEDEASGSKS